MPDWVVPALIAILAIAFIAAVATGRINFPDEHDYR